MPASPNPADSRRYFDKRFDATIINVAPGAQAITGDGGEVLSTVLGSCVAACIRDGWSGLGGMNHFLLPREQGAPRGDLSGADMRFGSAAMETLINALIRRGALRGRLEAKIFGGARIMAGSTAAVGERNILFVQRFLEREGIPVVGGDLGGAQPRRVNYAPVSGKAWVSHLDNPRTAGLIEAEAAYRQTLTRRDPAQGLEIF
jgi:chemotaxis protein CheD